MGLSGRPSEARRTSKKRKHKRAATKKKPAAKKAKVESESEDDEEALTPELLAIKYTVYAILAVVDKSIVTMKMVRKQAEEKLGKPLVQHKGAIKEMVRQFFAN